MAAVAVGQLDYLIGVPEAFSSSPNLDSLSRKISLFQPKRGAAEDQHFSDAASSHFPNQLPRRRWLAWGQSPPSSVGAVVPCGAAILAPSLGATNK